MSNNEVFQAVVVTPMEIGSTHLSTNNNYLYEHVESGGWSSLSSSFSNDRKTKRLFLKVGVLMTVIFAVVIWGSSGGKSNKSSDDAAAPPINSENENPAVAIAYPSGDGVPSLPAETWNPIGEGGSQQQQPPPPEQEPKDATPWNGEWNGEHFHPATPLVCPYSRVIQPRSVDELKKELFDDSVNVPIFALFYFPYHHEETKTTNDMTVWSKVAFQLTEQKKEENAPKVDVAVVNCHMVSRHHPWDHHHEGDGDWAGRGDGADGGNDRRQLRRSLAMMGGPGGHGGHMRDGIWTGHGGGGGMRHKDHEHWHSYGSHEGEEHHHDHPEHFVSFFNACEAIDINTYPTVVWYDANHATQNTLLSTSEEMFGEEALITFASQQFIAVDNASP